MKSCSICSMKKPETDFFFRDKRANRLHAQCKACYVEKRKRIWREHYHKYGNHYRERAVERNRKLKDTLRQQMLIYLSDKSCAVCRISDPRVLEFDHIDPTTKAFSIAKGITNILSWEKLLAEIEKCQILCANCHKIRTAEQQNWYKHSNISAL